MRGDILQTIDEVKKIIDLCDDKKGVDIVALDVRGICDITDYFVIVSGNSRPHVNAISDNVQRGMRNFDIKASHVEGEREAQWIVIDFFNIIVHVFHKDIRGYYNLERLWGDAPRLADESEK